MHGASGWKRFRYVIFPLMAPSTTINLTLSIIGCLKVFDVVFTMTKGGPGHYTEVVGTYRIPAVPETERLCFLAWR